MLKLRVIAPIVGMAMLVSLPASAVITGSSHDFTDVNQGASGWGETEICVVCHTPHDANDEGNAPLWNHDSTTVAAYTLYTSDTLDATDLTQPSHYSSKLCLSCHDGTVAKDAYNDSPGPGTDLIDPADWGYVGIDLSSEHPINFTYDNALYTADGGLHDPATSDSGLGGSIANDLLFNGTLGCASCHDVHNADGNAAMLRVDNTASAFCLKCHDK